MIPHKLVQIAFCMSLCIPVMQAQTITFTQSDKTVIYPAANFIQGDINRDGYPDFLFGLADSTNIYTYISDEASRSIYEPND